jgi:uncharacterized protein with HEPN domain
MLENIERIASYVAGMGESEFQRDGRTRDAVERCLERICEAAFRLGDLAATLMPDQPWGKIRGMGNRLRHGYDRINSSVVWLAVLDELPTLQADEQRALEQLTSNSPR